MHVGCARSRGARSPRRGLEALPQLALTRARSTPAGRGRASKRQLGAHLGHRVEVGDLRRCARGGCSGSSSGDQFAYQSSASGLSEISERASGYCSASNRRLRAVRRGGACGAPGRPRCRHHRVGQAPERAVGDPRRIGGEDGGSGEQVLGALAQPERLERMREQHHPERLLDRRAWRARRAARGRARRRGAGACRAGPPAVSATGIAHGPPSLGAPVVHDGAGVGDEQQPISGASQPPAEVALGGAERRGWGRTSRPARPRRGARASPPVRQLTRRTPPRPPRTLAPSRQAESRACRRCPTSVAHVAPARGTRSSSSCSAAVAPGSSSESSSSSRQ